jgi:homoserine acetyltransferase
MRNSRAESIMIAFVVVASLTDHAQQSAAHDQQQYADLGTCKLAGGGEITSCRLGYRTWGMLDAERSNAVVFPTWFAGTSSNVQDWVGADKLVDPAKYFVIAVDALGDGVSSSPSNSASQHGPQFPSFTMRDTVRSIIVGMHPGTVEWEPNQRSARKEQRQDERHWAEIQAKR